jgi:addiction module HigA family antidote
MDIIKAYQGIAPGSIIAHEIKKRGLSQRTLASTIQEHYQTLNAIIKGKRQIPTGMAFKLDEALGYEPGSLLILQAYHTAAVYKQPTLKTHPVIRKIVFWDIDMATLDWEKHKDFIIERVNSRGNTSEKQQVAAYYGTKQ